MQQPSWGHWMPVFLINLLKHHRRRSFPSTLALSALTHSAHRSLMLPSVSCFQAHFSYVPSSRPQQTLSNSVRFSIASHIHLLPISLDLMTCSLRLGIPEITYYSFRSNTYKVILQYCRGLFPVQPRIFKSADVKVPYIEWHRTMHTVGLLHLQIPNCESKLHFLIVVH